MTDRQLTDSEIIKALDCCKYDDCNNCPNVSDNCHANLVDYVLDFIDRQKAEIEELYKTLDDKIVELQAMRNAANSYKSEVERLEYCNSVNVSSIGTLHERLKEAKAEAIREFAEKVKQEINFSYAVWRVFDNLVKEMVGDK